MHIQCTKKLLDFLKPEFTEVNTDNDLFAWHANYVNIHRKKYIVFMNDLTRFCVVMYGLKKSDFKNIKLEFQKGIIVTMTFLGYEKELIDKYLRGMGEVTYNKTKNRKLVAQLNRANEDAWWYADGRLYDQIHQPEIANMLNTTPVGTNNWKEVHYPKDKMLEYLEML